MAAPSPSLSLSDIMHTFSPPPLSIPPKSTSPPPRPRSITPEPLEPAEIEEMRRKVLGMGWGDSSKGKEKAESREQELADMLLRLTHPASLPQPSQLHAQAETIAHLIQQRDFLVKRSIEEHERWESEKDGWARAAQALIIQGRRESAQAEKEDAVAAQYALVTADPATVRMLEFERANVVLQNDKKNLQQKLTDTQARLTSLESELAQLKPLLLMQPFALTHSHPTGTARGWSAVLPSTSSAAASRREKGREVQRGRDRGLQDADIDMDDDLSEEDRPQQLLPRAQFRNPILRPVGQDQLPLQPSTPTSPYKRKGDYYRHRETPATSTIHYPSAQYIKPGKRRVVPGAPATPSKPTLSDARAEHLLLAARKIGKQRASILSGAFAHVQQQQQQQQQPQPPPEPSPYYKQKGTPPQPKAPPQPPKTPRRNANANTPLLTRTPLGQSGTTPSQPRTPLQSLLSAAQSVLMAPGGPSTAESPLAKRRKLDPAVTVVKSADTPPPLKKEKDKEKEQGQDEKNDEVEVTEKVVDKGKDRARAKAPLPGGVARVRSALDFLADQAEVYSTQPPSQESDDRRSKEPEDGQLLDVDMGDAEGETDDAADIDDMQEPDKDKGKEKADEPMLKSRAGTPAEPQPQQPQPEVEQLQPLPTNTDGNSRASTPASTSLSTLNVPPPSNNEPNQLKPSQFDGESNRRGSTPGSTSLGTPGSHTLMLAPPIDLTPRASRSPAPQPMPTGAAPNLGKRSRSPSAEGEAPRALSAPAIDSTSSSFTMFSLQRPQPVAPAPSGEPSVLLPSLGGHILEQDQGLPGNAASKAVEGIKFISDAPPRRTRSPYIKWTKEEDEQLAKAVAKHGQKWDLVQKALPSRGYHQVRQRWLRKLGVFDGSKLDLSSLETNAAAEFLNISTAPPTDDDGRPLSDARPTANPKLGLAPLNSEKALTGSSGSSGGAGRSLSPFPSGGAEAAASSGFPFQSDVSNPNVGRSSSWPVGGYGEGS